MLAGLEEEVVVIVVVDCGGGCVKSLDEGEGVSEAILGRGEMTSRDEMNQRTFVLHHTHVRVQTKHYDTLYHPFHALFPTLILTLPLIQLRTPTRVDHAKDLNQRYKPSLAVHVSAGQVVAYSYSRRRPYCRY